MSVDDSRGGSKKSSRFIPLSADDSDIHGNAMMQSVCADPSMTDTTRGAARRAAALATVPLAVCTAEISGLDCCCRSFQDWAPQNSGTAGVLPTGVLRTGDASVTQCPATATQYFDAARVTHPE